MGLREAAAAARAAGGMSSSPSPSSIAAPDDAAASAADAAARCSAPDGGGACERTAAPDEAPQAYSISRAASADAGGVRILLGYGEARDVGVTNESVSSFVRVLHAPSSGGDVEDALHWRPHLALPTAAWRRLQMSLADGKLSLWLDGVQLLTEHPLSGWKPFTNWAVGLHGARLVVDPVVQNM